MTALMIFMISYLFHVAKSHLIKLLVSEQMDFNMRMDMCEFVVCVSVYLMLLFVLLLLVKQWPE